jgi:Mn-containing catalase
MFLHLRGYADSGWRARESCAGELVSVLLGINPQRAVVSGGGSTPRDSLGNPWNAGYIVASGNLLADMRFNVTAESQGRLQVVRLYQLTEDAGVRDMFSFLLARDTMHQNQWLAAIEELKEEGPEDTPVPSNFPQEREMSEVSYKFQNFSEGQDSAQGRWAEGRQGPVRVRGRARGDRPADERARSTCRAAAVLDPQAADATFLFVSRHLEGRGHLPRPFFLPPKFGEFTFHALGCVSSTSAGLSYSSKTYSTSSNEFAAKT